MAQNDFDISKNGFFHLSDELKSHISQNGQAIKLVDYRIKRNEQLISLLRKVKTPCLQLLALEMETSLLMFFSPHKCQESALYLRRIIQDHGAKRSINAMENLMHIFKSGHSVPGDDLSEIAEHLKDASKDGLEVARAMCERGFFCHNQYREGIKSPNLLPYGIKLLENGISKGEVSGMSPGELSVWRYYLVDLRRHSLEDEEDDLGTFRLCLDNVTTSFEHFDRNAEGCVFYKCRLLVDIMYTLMKKKSEMSSLPSDVLSKNSETIHEFWCGGFGTVTELLEMSTDDYYISLRIGDLYSNDNKFHKALQYAENSLQLEENINCGARHLKLHACHNIARDTRSPEEREKYLKHAFDEGIKIEEIYMSHSSALVMARVCHQMSKINPQINNIAMEIPEKNLHYLEKGIRFAEIGITCLRGQAHSGLHSIMGECLFLLKKYDDSFLYLSKAMKLAYTSKSKYYQKCAMVLLNRYGIVLTKENGQEELISRIAAHIEEMWKTLHKLKDVKEEIVKFAVLNPQYIKHILQKINCKEVTEDYCRILREDRKTPGWLKEYCVQMMTIE